MNKKIILAVVLFILLLAVVPFLQAWFFTQHTSGKTIVDKPINAPYLKKPKKI